MMKGLSCDMLLPKFGEYNYYYEAGRNFWAHLILTYCYCL